MKQFIISYNYYGTNINQSINVVEMVEQLPDALKIETVIDVLMAVKGHEILNEIQVVILKERMKQLNLVVNQLLKSKEL
jgi:hypothetical protein